MIDFRPNNKMTSDLHLFKSIYGEHVFLVDGSQIYDIEESVFDKIYNESIQENVSQLETDNLLGSLGLINKDKQYIDKHSYFEPSSISSISLNIAQGCNMSCSYCYADEGKFGMHSRLMKPEVALDAIEKLINNESQVDNYLIGFMGGEPLLNKKLLYEVVPFAYNRAKELNKSVTFSLTTNATLINEEDINLFNSYPFVLTISIDGDKRSNDLYRKLNNKSSSYEKIMEKVDLIFKVGKPNKLNARVTVTPKNMDLKNILNHLNNFGFDEVGFSPVLVSPDKNLEFTKEDLEKLLLQMCECGEIMTKKIINQEKYSFGNFETAMLELYRGSHKPYPCGAVANYLSINAEGQYFACHRFVDNSAYTFGTLLNGLDQSKRENFMINNHVDTIEPCKSCWARYLCGGGCYHEVHNRGRISCDFIRSWLSFCLEKYILISSQNPQYFS